MCAPLPPSSTERKENLSLEKKNNYILKLPEDPPLSRIILYPQYKSKTAIS